MFFFWVGGYILVYFCVTFSVIAFFSLSSLFLTLIFSFFHFLILSHLFLTTSVSLILSSLFPPLLFCFQILFSHLCCSVTLPIIHYCFHPIIPSLFVSVCLYYFPPLPFDILFGIHLLTNNLASWFCIH